MHKTKIVMLDDWENFFTSNIDCSTFGDTIDFRVYQQTLLGDKLYDAIADAEVIILLRERTAVNQHFIDHAPHLKHIICTGNQVRNLDAEVVEKAGISVSFAKGGDSKSSTCELAWTLILASFKQLDKLRVGQHQPLWRQHADKQPAFIPPTLRGKQLGIIGLGSIGQKVATVAKAFGMNVVCWSPNMTPERAAEHEVEATSLENLLSSSDVISIHLVLGETTRHILNAQNLSLLKRNAILVNTSRAEIINTE
ncbi:MAG TPA: NAD(P)-dependent oxidoreductase, partial [Oligella sp.]|nr:NAD(P)-dependent oxidoreductase [Oligella sp.]